MWLFLHWKSFRGFLSGPVRGNDCHMTTAKKDPRGKAGILFFLLSGLGQITWVSISAITTTTGTPRSHRITGIFASIELLRTLRSAEKVTPFYQHCS
jgi:hypothetical protein